MKNTFHAQPAWIAIGWLLVLTVFTLSLTRIDPGVHVPGGDKFHHIAAYAALMYWWGMLQPAARGRWALSLALMGVGLELVQGQLPHRFMEWQDATANVIGVAGAWLLLLTPAAGLLGWVDRQLSNRSDSRLP